MGRRWLAAFVAVVLSTGLVLTACGQAAGATQVAVTETVFNITLQPNKVQAGKVLFVVTNPSIMRHEFLVIRTDLAPGNLPTDPTGHVKEDQVDILDTIEDVGPHESGQLFFADLPPGHYVLICNLPKHYQNGMHAELLVTDQNGNVPQDFGSNAPSASSSP